jgi:hypothetical protein
MTRRRAVNRRAVPCPVRPGRGWETVAPLALALAAAVVLAGCGSGTEPGTGAGASGTGGATGEAPADGESRESRPVCEIVPRASVSRILGPLAKEPQDTSVSGEQRCTYTGGTGEGITVAHGTGGQSALDFFAKTFAATPVGGLGDQAVETRSGRKIFAIKGGWYLAIFADTGDPGAVRATLADGLAVLD